MSKDDYPVISYKVLSYFYACIKEGISGDIKKAQELAGCNEVYFLSVIQDLIGNGYMSGTAAIDYSSSIVGNDLKITLKGTEFLDENSTMAKVRKALGESFPAIIQGAVVATSLI